MTRIIAGAARGRRLSVPSQGTRPTSDRAREALFSALESEVGVFAGIRFLDLYAGTGAVGLEAASRGAEAVTLVESDRAVARVLQANVSGVGLTGVAVRVADVRAVVAARADAPYDVVFLDPPYVTDDADIHSVLAGLSQQQWLNDEAVVVVERRSRGPAFEWPAGFAPQRSRRYGEAMLWTALWYRRGAPGAAPGTDD